MARFIMRAASDGGDGSKVHPVCVCCSGVTTAPKPDPHPEAIARYHPAPIVGKSVNEIAVEQRGEKFVVCCSGSVVRRPNVSQ
jgi:hypothetical protein